MTSMDRRGFVGLCAAGATAALASGRASLPARAAPPAIPTVPFSDGSSAPALGQGSWHMADDGASAGKAADALRLGLKLGMTLIDTAEIYGGGRAEEMIAPVIAGRREGVFLVSKVWPTHATPAGIDAALAASLKRLGTDHLDLYLLHARGDARLPDVVQAFEQARSRGQIRRWGVSNFSVADMNDLSAVPGGTNCATNQVLYNLAARSIESDLIPWCAARHMPIMAYSPLGAGGRATLLGHPALKQIATARGVSPAAIALAWAMRDARTIVVTETASVSHLREDAAAAGLKLSEADLKALDAAFPPPRAG